MVKRILADLCIILALVTLTLFILVQFNPGIVDSEFFAIILYSFCGVALITSVMFIARLRKD